MSDMGSAPQSYPPRLLAPGLSRWFEEGRSIAVTDSAKVQKEGDVYIIAPDRLMRGNESQTLVNGEPLTGKRDLTDGDFIHGGKDRWIFQKDAVADWRALGPRPEPGKLSDRLLKHLIIRDDGFSLDGGKTFAAWDKIACLSIEFRDNAYTITPILSAGKTAGSEFKGLLRPNIEKTLQHLSYAAPFALSIAEEPFRKLFPDPYIAASDMVVQRIDAGDFPKMDKRFVKGAALREDLIKQGLQQLGIGAAMALFGIIVTALTYASVSRSGGSYLLCYGPIIFGIFIAIGGAWRLVRATIAPTGG
jgi:hypothetical protein